MKRIFFSVFCFFWAFAGQVSASEIFNQPFNTQFDGFFSNISGQVGADQFEFSVPSTITELRWYGFYGDDLPMGTSEINFTIKFFNDNGGIPGSELLGEVVTAQLSDTGSKVTTRLYTGGTTDATVYEFRYKLNSSLHVAADEILWLMIAESDSDTVAAGDTQWQWIFSSFTATDTKAYAHGSDLTDWTLSDQHGNLAFELHGNADNGILTVTHPNGGEVLSKGQDYTITWNSADVSGNVQIDLYKGGTDPSDFVIQLAASDPDDGNYLFNPPDTLADGTDYLIGISAEAGTVWDFSDAPFTIQAALPPPGYIYYDDFDSASIDTSLWNIFDPGNVLSQSAGFLYADNPPNSVYGQLYSTQTFNGNFEIVLQYSEFQSTATQFSGNSPQISLQVASLSSPGDFIYIFRGYDDSGHNLLTNGVVNGEWQHIYSNRDSAASSSGLLKISRTGSTITAHYNEGSGWVSLSSFPNAFAGEITIQVSAYTGDNGTFHVASDGIYYMASNPPIAEIIGTWSNGIWYWDEAASEWTKMSSGMPTGDIAAGDFTGDGKADVASCWDSGLWYQDGVTMDWTKVSSSAPGSVTAGDVTGDGQAEIIGTWVSGIWYWDEAASEWTKMSSGMPTGDIAAGDFTGDGKADVASCWDSGLWYQDGDTSDWTKVSGAGAVYLTASDVTGDGRSEIISTWSNGIWYWDEAASEWTKMSSVTPDGDITAGDFTGDGKADVASCWDSGLWYQDGDTSDWTKVSNTAPTQVTAGDVTGN